MTFENLNVNIEIMKLIHVLSIGQNIYQFIKTSTKENGKQDGIMLKYVLINKFQHFRFLTHNLQNIIIFIAQSNIV